MIFANTSAHVILARDIDRALSALDFIDPPLDREGWVKLLMAAHDAGISEDDARDWSERGENFNPADFRDTWRSITSGAVTRRTLFKAALDAGWDAPVDRKSLTTVEIAARDAERSLRREQAAKEKDEREAKAAMLATKIWQEAQPANDNHPYLQKKGVKAYGIRIGAWKKIDRESGEVHVIEDALLIQMRDTKNNTHSVQFIFRSKDNVLGKDRVYLGGGAKKGHFFTIGKLKTINGRNVIVIVEGYSTGASIHECTGHAVVVAFDKGNLEHVARVIRQQFSEADIIIFSDRDAEALEESGGTKLALKAALAANARIVVPEWCGLQGRDANDIHRLGFTWGSETFLGKDTLDACVRYATPCRSPAFMDMLQVCGIDASDLVPHQIDGSEPQGDADAAGKHAPVASDDEDDQRAAGHFAVLGFAGDRYYIFHHRKRQVLERSRHDFTDVSLVELAPRNWWEMNGFAASGGKGGIDKAAAAEWVFGVAHARGFFEIENRMRGRGAWRDHGRSVFHHGDHLTVDGVQMDLTAIQKSKFIYENKAPLPAVGESATSLDGGKLLATAQMMRWVNPASAMFLCGWVFLAPIGGALRWRPHIWITGESGSGKSHILRDFAGRLLGATKLSLDAGDSSAAGVRQKLKRDALPVVLDEAEAKDDRGRERIRGILTLARGASTDGDTMIAKGTVSGRALEFSVRSMFCLGAIGALAQAQESDNSRFATLAVRNKSDTSKPDQWVQLKPALADIERDDGLPARLLTRGILMLPTLYQCISIFAAAAAKRLGSERYGDQYGALLAGCWCLSHDEVVTDVEAQRIVEGIQWDDYFAETRQATPDAAKCLDAILDHLIVEKGSSVSIRALVALASGRMLEGYDISSGTARRLLQDRGLTITSNKDHGRMLGIMRDSRAVGDMLRNTDFASDWQTQLPRVAGYEPLRATTYGASGQNRGHGFPLKSIRLPDDSKQPPTDDEPPI